MMVKSSLPPGVGGVSHDEDGELTMDSLSLGLGLLFRSPVTVQGKTLLVIARRGVPIRVRGLDV